MDGPIEIPRDLQRVDIQEAERVGQMLDVRGVFEEIFAPNVATLDCDRYTLPNQTVVKVNQQLAPIIPGAKR